MNAITYQKLTQPFSRERYYTFVKYDNGTALLSIDSAGITTTIHFGKGDMEKLGEDFNAG